MKSFLTVLLAAALALMPSAAMGVVPATEVSCAKPADPCCASHPDHAAPTKACDQPIDSCAHCSLVCCAFLPAKADALPVPARANFRWKLVAEKGDARTEPPPLPPPRVS